MLLDVSYECAIEYSIGFGSSIEYGNRIFYRIASSIEYSIPYSIGFYRTFNFSPPNGR
jgi:hypothetical protein